MPAIGPGVKIKASTLYDVFKKWAEAANERQMTQRLFGDAMSERGYQRQHSGGTWYLGIDLSAEF